MVFVVTVDAVVAYLFTVKWISVDGGTVRSITVNVETVRSTVDWVIVNDGIVTVVVGTVESITVVMVTAVVGFVTVLVQIVESNPVESDTVQ